MDISRIKKVILKNCQKIGKMTPLTVKNWIFKKNQKSTISYGTRFSQPKYHISFNPKIRFLGQKVCPVARVRTDGQTDWHESDYCGDPFMVSGVFPSTYHQGSTQKEEKKITSPCKIRTYLVKQPRLNTKGAAWQDQWTWRLTIFPQWRNLRDRFFKRSDAFCEVRPRIPIHFFPPFSHMPWLRHVS